MGDRMSAGSGSWAADHIGMRVLSENECADLLTGQQVGRLAFTADGQVEIFPVAFVLDRSAVVLRSGIGTKLLAAFDQIDVAFEVDHFEPASRSGWSVIVKGTCEAVGDPATLARLEATAFENWLEFPNRSDAYRWIRIRPYSITGRVLPPRTI
jgi:nitroimidazol reductase NimA-like FMN-containing flavoprotein (pyridoxamine 5'-phosphate oxidase superfamily)